MKKRINTTIREEAIKDLLRYQKISDADTEQAHIEADSVLCWLLEKLGYGDVVDEYEKIHKWYS